jgi:HSP20 family protein
MNTVVRKNRDADRAQNEQFVAPSASVVEAGDGYTLEVEMPGINKEGLEISIENNELTVLGHRSLPAVEGTLIHRESRPENYRRTFELDPSINGDKISAKIRRGHLDAAEGSTHQTAQNYCFLNTSFSGTLEGRER